MTVHQKQDPVLATLFSLVILSAFSSALIFEWGSATLNFSQLIGLLLFSALLLHHTINRKQIILLHKDAVSILIYLYFFINFISSLFFSPNRIQSLKGCAIILVYVIVYVCVRWMMKKISDPQQPVYKLMKLNLWSAIAGIAFMTVSLLTKEENFGVSYGHLAQSGINTLDNPLPSIRSFSLEPNLFAIITAVLLCINIAMYLLSTKSLAQLIVIIILTVAIVFSYTRSVYFSLFFSLITLMFLSKNLKLLLSLINFGVILFLIVLSIFFFLPDDSDLKAALVSRTSSLFEFGKGSGLGRVYSYQIGLEGFWNNPILGNGTLSADTRVFNIYTQKHQELFGSAGWLNGSLIQSLHDTGIVGFTILLMIYFYILYLNYKTFRRLRGNTTQRSMIMGFIAGNIILIISSQLSSTLWISFPYIYWGINMAFISLTKKESANND